MRYLVILFFLCFGCQLSQNAENEKKIERLIKLAEKSDSLMDLKKSIQYYSEILDINPLKLKALVCRGRAFVIMGEVGRGLADYNVAINHYPDENVYFARGMIFCVIKDFDRAQKDFKTIQKLNPKFGKTYYGLSLVSTGKGKLDEAIQFCNIADSIVNDVHFSNTVRIEMFRKKGDFVSAISLLDIAIKDSPNDFGFYNDRGCTKNSVKNYEEAIKDFDKAIEINVKYAYAYNNKAESLLMLKQYDSALKEVNTSLNLNDKNAYAYKNRAKIYQALNLKKQACDDLLKAQQNDAYFDEDLKNELLKLETEICTE